MSEPCSLRRMRLLSWFFVSRLCLLPLQFQLCKACSRGVGFHPCLYTIWSFYPFHHGCNRKALASSNINCLQPYICWVKLSLHAHFLPNLAPNRLQTAHQKTCNVPPPTMEHTYWIILIRDLVSSVLTFLGEKFSFFVTEYQLKWEHNSDTVEMAVSRVEASTKQSWRCLKSMNTSKKQAVQQHPTQRVTYKSRTLFYILKEKTLDILLKDRHANSAFKHNPEMDMVSRQTVVYLPSSSTIQEMWQERSSSTPPNL